MISSNTGSSLRVTTHTEPDWPTAGLDWAVRDSLNPRRSSALPFTSFFPSVSTAREPLLCLMTQKNLVFTVTSRSKFAWTYMYHCHQQNTKIGPAAGRPQCVNSHAKEIQHDCMVAGERTGCRPVPRDRSAKYPDNAFFLSSSFCSNAFTFGILTLAVTQPNLGWQ